MKLTIEQSVLLKALSHVQSIVESKPTIPILSNILLHAENLELTISATDFTLDVVERVSCSTVSEAGSTTVDAKVLFNIVRRLPDGSQIELATIADQERITVRAGRSSFDLPTMLPTDFPAIHAFEPLPASFDLVVSDLKHLIDQSKFAMSTEETRYYLNGIYLHVKNLGKPENGAASESVLRVVATDGHRLARVQLPLPEGAESIHPADAPGFIIPRKAVLELRKLIDEPLGENDLPTVTLSASDKVFRFSYGKMILTTKLVDGTFPDYERVIPVTNDKKLEVNVTDFKRSVERISPLSTELNKAIKLGMKESTLTLSMNSSETGSGTDELDVDYKGSELEVGFNWKYLLDICEVIQGGHIQFVLADSSGPAIIRDATSESAVFVLMPLRV